MPFLKKPAFENYRARLIASGKPIADWQAAAIQTKIVALLDTVPEILVQKARRMNHKDGLIEVSATWVGLDANPTKAVGILKSAWPGDAFDSTENNFWLDRSEDAVLLAFAAPYPDGRYLTGRVLVVF